MATNGRSTTADELLRMPEDGYRYELVRGDLRRVTPAGFDHGDVAMELGRRLANHVVTHDLGRVVAAGTGFLLARNPDIVRAPDVAYLSHERLAGTTHTTGYLAIAPDIVAEVLSPNDRGKDVIEKVHAWLSAGVRMVLVVNPRDRTIAVHRADTPETTLADDDVLDGADVLPGLALRVRHLFRARA